MRVVVAALLFGVGCTAADVAAQGVVGASLAADYLQTRQITRDGYEGNPFIGKYGERIPPARYFLAAFALHTAIAVLLPRPYRYIWQGSWAVAEGVTVWNNRVDGYGVTW